MANSITMTYGDYIFTPVPLLNISKEYQKTDDGTLVGTQFNVSLEGTLTPLPTGTLGYVEVDILQDALKTALANEGDLFKVSCDGTTIIETYPRIIDLNFTPSNNQWVMTSPYTVNLQWDDDPVGSGENSGIMPEYISIASEDWSIEHVEDHNQFNWTLNDGSSTEDGAGGSFRVSHTVGATGKRHYVSSGGTGGQLDKQAWEAARDYVIPRLGWDDAQFVQTGVLNLDASLFDQYNHIRNVSVGELGGTYQVTETWLTFATGALGVPGTAHEDFSIETRESRDDGLISVSIQGNLNGFETKTYGTVSGDHTISTSKYQNALDTWNIVKSRLYWRADKALENSGLTSTRGLHITPKTKSIGQQPSNGIITYAYEYDDRPCNMITGARLENIQIDENYPTDVFASLTVLGRANGPVLQSLSTVSPRTRNVNIEAVMEAPSGDCTNCSTQLSSMLSLTNAPTTNVENILCCLEADLTDAYSQVFKTADSATWNPRTGRFTRSVSWTYTDCTGAAPSTSFC